ncbi:MAG TPA: hypothetical protein VK629_20740 [Steroidobacteraceae bacterium]|nr:hypothetical protein [Steroidobacteraceae bacterium]
MNQHQRNFSAAGGALFASSSTLVCCVLPAVLVSLGAGVTLAGLVSAFPQLIWLSEHKFVVFGFAGAMLLVSGISLWRARLLPCPIDPSAAKSCQRLRRISYVLYAVALIAYLVAIVFAFVLPIFGR